MAKDGPAPPVALTVTVEAPQNPQCSTLDSSHLLTGLMHAETFSF